MKIALTHPYSWPEVRRGAERILFETARCLTGRGHDVTVLTAGARAERYRRDGYVVIRGRRLFMRAGVHERWFGWWVSQRLLRERFDVVHAIMPCDALGAIRTQRLRGHRSVYDEMGVPGLFWDRWKDGRIRWKVARGVDVYGCMSQYALDALRESCGREGVLIPGGVRLDEFRPAPQRNQTPTLLFSGAFDERFKGVASLLEALPLVAAEVPGVKLWLSGPGRGKVLDGAPPEVRELVEILPLGTPDEQADRYGRAWAVVHPSHGESFGMVLLEALACGTPIVTTDDGAPQELVSEATGVVAPRGDIPALARAIVQALELARDPDTVARCRSSVSGYDWDQALAPALEELYRPTTVPA